MLAMAYQMQESQCAISRKVASSNMSTAAPYSEYLSNFRATRTNRNRRAVFKRPINVVVCKRRKHERFHTWSRITRKREAKQKRVRFTLPLTTGLQSTQRADMGIAIWHFQSRRHLCPTFMSFIAFRPYVHNAKGDKFIAQKLFSFLCLNSLM